VPKKQQPRLISKFAWWDEDVWPGDFWKAWDGSLWRYTGLCLWERVN
jgi:hypothetical protein